MIISLSIGVGITALRGSSTSAPTFGVSNASDGSATIAGVTTGADSITVEVTDTIPAAFEDTYVIPLADLADGVEMLRTPIISGTEATMTGTQALWVYDPAAYAAAGKVFAPTRLWHLDGAGITDADGYTFTPSATGTYTLVETVEKPDGNFATATSNEIVVSGGVALTSELLDSRWIDLSGIVADSRQLIVVGMFEDAKTAANAQCLITDNDSISPLDTKVHLLVTGTYPRARGADPAGGLRATLASGSSVTDATGRPLALYSATNMDNFASSDDTHTVAGGVSALADYTQFASDPAIPANPMSLLSELVVNGGARTTARWAAGTKLRFLWIARTVPPAPNDNRDDLAAAIRDAFFSVNGTAPNITVGPQALPADGVMTIAGVEITPVVFLAGEHFGQYDDAGTKRLTNRGTGADPILNGDFFA